MQDLKPKSAAIHKEIEIIPTETNQIPDKTTIRLKAEELAKEKESLSRLIESGEIQESFNLSNPEIRRLIYELEVHQIELEMQNEELQRAKEQIESSAEKYTELFDFAPAAYFTLSRDGNICELNHYASQLLGRERSSLINSRFGFFVTDDSKPEFNHFFESLFSRNTKVACEISIFSDDSNLPVNVYLSGIVQEGSKKCLIAAIDISDRKRVEEEIKRKNSELQKVNAEKDKFFSIIAHDLRSPFNGFLGLTEMLAEGVSAMNPEEIRKIVLLLKNSATNLNNLLGNLLEWSMMKRGLISFTPKSYLLRPGYDECLALALDAAKVKNIRIDCGIPEDLVVYADKNMLNSVFRNLVSNAVKFTPQGGRIIISVRQQPGKWMEFSIRDSGIGMDKNLVEKLFSLDENIGRKGTNGELSTGLGLIICKDFVENHGGKLWAESEVGKGSIFRFTIPERKNRE